VVRVLAAVLLRGSDELLGPRVLMMKPPTKTGREGGSFRRLLFFVPDLQVFIIINDSLLNLQNLLPSLPTLKKSMSSKGFRDIGVGGQGWQPAVSSADLSTFVTLQGSADSCSWKK
jgi:hypothetical protein